MPAMGYATVYPVVMFLRVLTAQLLMLMAIPAVAAATPEPIAPVEEAVVVVAEPAESVEVEVEETDSVAFEELVTFVEA